MAKKDDDNHDEYEFSELDMSEPSVEPVEPQEVPPKVIRTQSTPVWRNVIIVVGLILIMAIAYKVIQARLAKNAAQQTAVIQPISTPQPITVQPQPIVVAKVVPADNQNKINDKLETLSLNQDGVRSQLSAVNTDLETLKSNNSELTQQLAEMRQLLTSVNTKLDEQAQEFNALMAAKMAPPPPVAKVVKQKRILPRYTYFIQALIPGRAWITSSEGATLTVRLGSHVPGYGKVKLIDATQGRVVMSSGRIIRFSQLDS